MLMKHRWKSTTLAGIMCIFFAVVIAHAAGKAVTVSKPTGWVMDHWIHILSAAAAFFVVHYVRRMDQKFDVLFEWKHQADERFGVHDQVWGHGGGCGPLWVHHRGDGRTAIHYRDGDHPGLCTKCKELHGQVIQVEEEE